MKIEVWTRKQRKTLLGLCVIVLIFLAVEDWRKPVSLPDPPANSSPQSAEIQGRLDPNIADAAALSAIPNLGEGRAQTIVDYREMFERRHPGVPAFKRSADLMRIKGIGPGIVVDVEPYLIFTH